MHLEATQDPEPSFDPGFFRWDKWRQSTVLGGGSKKQSLISSASSGSSGSSSTTTADQSEKYVFAHFIAGNAANMSLSDWASDIALAKSAKIDGFALNIAASDTHNSSILRNAYQAAESAGSFKLFLSFDYSGGAWNPAQAVIPLINQYKTSNAQFFYNGRPLVSTFGGADSASASAWFGGNGIRASTNCFFMPNWQVDPTTNALDQFGQPDGAFSWIAWPTGANDMTPDEDGKWMTMLAATGNRPYMMPVSPWFYTNMPDYSKNWLWRGDDLWHDRWTQAIKLQPAMVEILTWNDYGESHYIGPIHTNGIPSGSLRYDYVSGMPHEGWLADLANYIDAYKSGGNLTTTTPTTNDPTEERITYWYKLNPDRSGSRDQTVGSAPWQQPPVDPTLVSQDQVFVTVFVKQPSTVSVQIGSASKNNPPTQYTAASPGINHFSVPLNGRTGAVSIVVSRGGNSIMQATGGREITTACMNGIVNWNAYVGTTSRLYSNPIQK